MKKPQTPNDEDKPEYYEWSTHPKYWPGQLFPEDELIMMGEGDRDNRLDADYYGTENHQQSHN